jgi:hypothetical protein
VRTALLSLSSVLHLAAIVAFCYSLIPPSVICLFFFISSRFGLEDSLRRHPSVCDTKLISPRLHFRSCCVSYLDSPTHIAYTLFHCVLCSVIYYLPTCLAAYLPTYLPTYLPSTTVLHTMALSSFVCHYLCPTLVKLSIVVSLME